MPRRAIPGHIRFRRISRSSRAPTTTPSCWMRASARSTRRISPCSRAQGFTPIPEHASICSPVRRARTAGLRPPRPLGLRVRLRADFDLSRFHGPSLVILRALQRYGMFLTDTAGGQFWAVAGSLDARWPVDDLELLKSVPASAFEVVQLGTVHAG